MIWHKLFHRVIYSPVVSAFHPHRWVCACGKVWQP